MLSSSQAFQEWLSVLELLRHVGAHAAAHPHHVTMPQNLLEDRLARSTLILNSPLGSPQTTWKLLLHKKVGGTAKVSEGTLSVSQSVVRCPGHDLCGTVPLSSGKLPHVEQPMALLTPIDCSC